MREEDEGEIEWEKKEKGRKVKRRESIVILFTQRNAVKGRQYHK